MELSSSVIVHLHSSLAGFLSHAVSPVRSSPLHCSCKLCRRSGTPGFEVSASIAVKRGRLPSTTAFFLNPLNFNIGKVITAQFPEISIEYLWKQGFAPLRQSPMGHLLASSWCEDPGQGGELVRLMSFKGVPRSKRPTFLEAARVSESSWRQFILPVNFHD